MRSEKAFTEVFDSYKPSDKETGDLLEEITVLRVRMNSARTLMVVDISCHYPIHKKTIYALEKDLAGSLDPRKRLKIRIHEHFELSSQYDPRGFYDEYKGSIGYEMKVTSPMMYAVYNHARKNFTDDGRLVITLADSVVARDMETELTDYLYGIFTDRAGLGINISIEYEKAGITAERLEAERRVQQQIAAISDRARAVRDDARNEKKTYNKGKKSFGASSGNTFRQKGSERSYNAKKSDDPSVIYGYDVMEKSIPIADIENIGERVTVRGQVITVEEREIRDGEKLIIRLSITDFTDTMAASFFIDKDEWGKIKGDIKEGSFLKLTGTTTVNKYERDMFIGMVKGIRKIDDFRTKREDLALNKRTELHCHTKMSNMDAVCSVEDVISTAIRWGWKSIAITDHGGVQAFTGADHMKKPDDFKVIYGMEGYLVDDMRNAVGASGDPDMSIPHMLDDTYCVFDIETTGFSPVNHRIIEIGAVIVQGGKIVDRFDEFVNPGVPIPYRITKLTTITDAMVKDADPIDKVLPRFLEFSRGAVMVGHNVTFDISFIAENAARLGIPFDRVYADTMVLSRLLMPHLGRHTLDRVAKELGVVLEQHHRAVDDAGATGGIWSRMTELLKERGITELSGINEELSLSDEAIRHLATFHIILLAKNETGRVNLYRLVSQSHVRYFGGNPGVPRIPKSLIMAHREGLIIGSACERGELYRAVSEGRNGEDIANIVKFYDYLEIQPIANNRFLIPQDNEINSDEDLRDINRKITELGEQFHKPVCATCDVHFLDPEDEVYRRIITYGKGMKDADNQPPLYLRTTDEMLEEFSYLGSDKAREVVIANPNLISDMIDPIRPVRPDKCPPVIENSDETLRKICEDRAHELYGDELPEEVRKRMDTELDSIIGNGYAVLYVIAQKLVWKSNEDGYLVGSRGSVGSSFAAYLAGITEVNSLRPHYLCPKCRYSDFDSDIVMNYHETNTCGIDLPDAVCPVCGTPLQKLGFDIPFETFLGFKGDKEPDIDLNFSSDYQSKSHKYTEVIFGSGYAYRAGTMGTMADKTAYGYVKKYYEEHGVSHRSSEVERLAKGCTGVLRTTGQHPGGIVVLPHGEEMDTFTPVQHPADNINDSTLTTHFDYHSIDHNLLKLDNLGHQDPTMIKFLQDITGVKPEDIPLDDKKVMTLFKDTSALGISSDAIGGTPNGSMGLPEFGTDNAIKMVMEAAPTNFTDLVRISGLSHGTGVWAGNAQDLIRDNVATLSECICCRDDIMLYLIGKGMDPQLSFNIMEAVRKGKGLSKKGGEDSVKAENEMLSHDVPEWYVKSCKTIEYMFPKAHAAAYVMMAFRIAWFKVYMPQAYYCAFYSVRAKGFSYEKCCMGPEALDEYIKDYKRRENLKGEGKLTSAEQDELHDMRIVQEMYARGIEFCPIDLGRVMAEDFQLVDGKIMPSLSSISSIGPKAADAIISNIADAEGTGPFLSVDDFCLRSGASEAIANKLKELNILGDIPESNQLSIFDI